MDLHMQNIHNRISKEYEKTRNQNTEKHRQIIKKIYDHIPEIKEIDKKLQNIGISVCGEVLKGSINAEHAIENMQKEVDELNGRKSQLLIKSGIQPTIMNEIFSCTECKDKGFVNEHRCKCYNDKLYSALRKMSNICANENNTFEKYNLSLYAKEPDPSYGVSPYENAKSILNIAQKYALNTNNKTENLLFYGATGLGKTFVSDCIANEFIKNGRTVLYMSAPKLFTMFEDYKFGRNTTDSVKSTIDAVNSAELLIIDDLGTEFRSGFSDSILFDIINTRLNEGKKMILSTNLNPSQIADIYSERISSRIIGGFIKIIFFGEDIRLKKA